MTKKAIVKDQFNVRIVLAKKVVGKFEDEAFGGLFFYPMNLPGGAPNQHIFSDAPWFTQVRSLFKSCNVDHE
jgi:hypothetical protein